MLYTNVDRFKSLQTPHSKFLEFLFLLFLKLREMGDQKERGLTD